MRANIRPIRTIILGTAVIIEIDTNVQSILFVEIEVNIMNIILMVGTIIPMVPTSVLSTAMMATAVALIGLFIIPSLAVMAEAIVIGSSIAKIIIAVIPSQAQSPGAATVAAPPPIKAAPPVAPPVVSAVVD